MQPECTATDIRATVDNEWLTAGGNDLLIDAFDQDSVRTDRYIVLILDEALIDRQEIGMAIAAELDCEMLVSIGDFSNSTANRDIRIGDAPDKVHNRLYNFEDYTAR